VSVVHKRLVNKREHWRKIAMISETNRRAYAFGLWASSFCEASRAFRWIATIALLFACGCNLAAAQDMPAASQCLAMANAIKRDSLFFVY
jgi:hypothetical protein